jgi:hypothetical protein
MLTIGQFEHRRRKTSKNLVGSLLPDTAVGNANECAIIKLNGVTRPDAPDAVLVACGPVGSAGNDLAVELGTHNCATCDGDDFAYAFARVTNGQRSANSDIQLAQKFKFRFFEIVAHATEIGQSRRKGKTGNDLSMR